MKANTCKILKTKSTKTDLRNKGFKLLNFFIEYSKNLKQKKKKKKKKKDF